MIQLARGIVENLRGDALVDDVEVFGQAQQGRALAQNVVRQAVQRADAIAHVGQARIAIGPWLRKPRMRRAKLSTAELAKVTISTSSSPRIRWRTRRGGEVRQDGGLAAAGHGRDAEITAGVEEGQDFLLIGTRVKDMADL